MKAFYNQIPDSIEPVGDGTWYFRWDIVEVVSESGTISYQCNEVIALEASNTAIKKAVISALWSSDVEAKLLNDYYSALEGILTEDKKLPYLEFLNERKRIKSLIDETLK